jgi:hypothetical protein
MSKLQIQKNINEILGDEILHFKLEARQIVSGSNVCNLHLGGACFKSWTGM